DSPSPVSDENANAELLVPRSMPMLNLACAITYPYQKARSGGTRIDRGREVAPHLQCNIRRQDFAAVRGWATFLPDRYSPSGGNW
ncbi:MAG: hypothetical protein WCC41_13995, partial [Rhodomicrobium sp.]